MNEEEKLESQNLPDQDSGNENKALDKENKSVNEAGAEQNPANDIPQIIEQNTIIEQTAL